MGPRCREPKPETLLHRRCSRPASALASSLHNSQMPWPPDLFACHGPAVWVSFPSVSLSVSLFHLVSFHRRHCCRTFSHLHSHTSRPFSCAHFSPRTCPFQPFHTPASSGPSCLCHISKRPPTGSRLAIDAGGGLLMFAAGLLTVVVLLSYSVFFSPRPGASSYYPKETSWPRPIFYFPLPDAIHRHLFSSHSQLHSFRSASGSPLLGPYMACASSCIPTSWPAVLVPSIFAQTFFHHLFLQ